MVLLLKEFGLILSYTYELNFDLNILHHWTHRFGWELSVWVRNHPMLGCFQGDNDCWSTTAEDALVQLTRLRFNGGEEQCPKAKSWFLKISLARSKGISDGDLPSFPCANNCTRQWLCKIGNLWWVFILFATLMQWGLIHISRTSRT